MEILLAMTVAVFALAGAVLVAFGGQSLDIGTAQNSEALVLAEEMINDRQAAAAEDFRRVNSTAGQTGIFTQRTEVSTHSFFTKKIIASVGWDFGGRRQNVTLQTLISDWRGTAGNDTCDSNLSGDWKNPQVEKIIDFSDFAESASSTYAIGDIDVYKNKLYVAMEKTGTKTDATLFIFDISNVQSPTKIDNAQSTINGLSKITVNGDYIYAASNHTPNFSTCVQNYNCAQLQIINLDSLAILNFKLPNIFGESGKGNSIFYQNGYVYLGLANANGPEFNIINVGDTGNPVVAGSFEIGAGINDIYVKGNYAYLATADSNRELIIINVADPFAPNLVAGYNLLPDQTNWGYGENIQVIGNKIYFGRTYIANSPEFYLLDCNQSLISMLGNYSENGAPFSVNDIIVRDNLAFILTGSGSQGGDLRILDIADPGDIAEEKTVDLPGEAGGRGGAAMDCEGNYLYVASVDAQGKSYLSVITAK